MGFFIFFVISGYVTIASALSCYNCTERIYFNQDMDMVKITPCTTPLRSTSESVNLQTDCTGKCGTSLSLPSSHSVGHLSVVRSCVEDDAFMDDAATEEFIYSSQCNNCTDLNDCVLCCDSSDRCNGAAVADIIQNNSIGQTCYECRHSEIPGDTLNPGCGLDFDPEEAVLSYTFCKGLCFTAVAFIEGFVDVERSCMYDRSICDRDSNQTDVVETVRHGDFDYEVRCCLGSLCNGFLNRAQSISATTSIILTMFIASYAAFLTLVM